MAKTRTYTACFSMNKKAFCPALPSLIFYRPPPLSLARFCDTRISNTAVLLNTHAHLLNNKIKINFLAVWLMSDMRVKLQTVTILGISVHSGLSLVAGYCNKSAGYCKFANELNITK